jgi:hypothetical protein
MKMVTQQMMELLLARMNVSRKEHMQEMAARMDANQAEMKADRESDRDQMLTEISARMEADRKSKREDLKDMMEEMMNANQEEMRSIVNAWVTDIKDARKKTTACKEATEADTEKTEPDPGMMQSVAELQVALKEDAAVKPVKGRKNGKATRRAKGNDQRRLWSRKEVGCRLQEGVQLCNSGMATKEPLEKIGTQENCGPRKELAVVGIRTTRCAKVSRGREHGLQRQRRHCTENQERTNG